MNTEYIRSNIKTIQSAVSEYPGARLLAAVKNRSCEEINFAVKECGVTLIGENRVQELLSHLEGVDRKSAGIHFIGTLQKNKVKYLPGRVDVIESVDSKELAAEIDRRFAAAGLKAFIYAEVNIGREPGKSGVMPEELPGLLSYLSSLKNTATLGLMTMAPAGCTADGYRGYFSELKSLSETVFREAFPDIVKPELSMGMSGSYMYALECGATIIRAGTAVFGERSRSNPQINA